MTTTNLVIGRIAMSQHAPRHHGPITVTHADAPAHTLYVAGPMRGYPRYNFDAFDAATAQLRHAGYEVHSPAEMDRQVGFDPDKHEADPSFVESAMARDRRAISVSDGICLLDGWQDSVGTRAELDHAANFGLRIGHLDYWLAQAAGNIPLVNES